MIHANRRRDGCPIFWSVDCRGNLKRQLEERARAHDRNPSQEIIALLQIALERSEPAEIQGAEVGLGTLLATTFPKQHDYDDFVPPPRNGPHRPGPDFDQPTPNIALDAPQKPPAKRRE